MKSCWQPATTLAVLEKRARMLQVIRAFFDTRGVLEVETPLLSTYASTDPHLQSLQTGVGDSVCFLNTSPEYGMKRLLAWQAMPVYQICKAFRGDESGPCHNPEFTMLEWYRPGYSLVQLMDEMQVLIELLFQSVSAGTACQFQRISYQQAFERYAGFNPHCCSVNQCRQSVLDHGVDIPVGMSAQDEDLDDWLDWVLTQVVLPSMPAKQFCFLYDYPVSQAALARIETSETGYQVARRFELLYGELELANAFYELTDAKEQKSRFEQEQQQRLAAGQPVPEMDIKLLAALEQGLPECSGVAVGLDRLLMVLSGCQSIDEVLTFSWSQI